MIDYAYKELFEQDSVPKNLIITYDNVTLTNDDISSESFELTESLCSEENITIGACEAGCIKFRIGYGTASLVGKELTVSILLNGAETALQLGKFIVDSDKLTADRRFRDITAYDVLYQALDKDLIAWYNTILPNIDSTCTMKQFRDSLFTYLNIEQESINLINDSITIRKTISAEHLSGKEILSSICEANACFGHINRQGKFRYIYLEKLEEGIYPSEDLYPSENLYPSDGLGVTLIGENATYIKAQYEDYETALISKLQIRQEEDDIGVIVGRGDESYIIEGNFLFFGMGTDELTPIANRILAKLVLISQRPSTIENKGLPFLEIGDGIEVVTKYHTICTYIQNRTLKGIQALRDTYTSTGSEHRGENINSIHSQIIQLQGKSNKLTRTIEETASELEAYETQTDGTLTSYNTRITQNANAITSESTRATGAENTLSSRITQTAEAITSEVTRASNAEGSLSSRITQNATDITSKVSKGSVSSEISQEAGQISISANRLVVNSDYFTLDNQGAGTLGGLTFDANGFYSDNNGTKVLRVYPNPSNGFALSVGEGIYRLLNMTILRDQASLSIGHAGEVYVTKLHVMDEVDSTGSSILEYGDLYVDNNISLVHGDINVRSTYLSSAGDVVGGNVYVDRFIQCIGNIESNGGIFARHLNASVNPSSGNLVAENYICANGDNSGSGDIEAYHDLIYHNACYQSSDRRLKEDIKSLDDSAVDFIYSLNPVEYRLKNRAEGEDKLHHGLIAQEINDDSRQLVKEQRDGYLSVAYTELIADLIKTVQSQNERIKALEEQISKLKEG